MAEIGGMDETTFCQLDCKFRKNPYAMTTQEIGLLIERGREVHWLDYIREIVNADQSYDDGYDEGVKDATQGEE
jgi:hypothetical protein